MPSRREFLKIVAGSAATVALPQIVTSRVLAALAADGIVRIGHIGCGRISNEADMPGILRQASARIVAVCDLDALRLAHAKKVVEEHYAKKNKPAAVKTYANYRDVLADPQIDAVVISTPDHWHAQHVVEAARAGKHVYVQKPLSLTIAEGRAASDVARAAGIILQVGSQQRSSRQFHDACELVRNGRVGKVHTVRIGLPTDPTAPDTPDEHVPPTLNYEMWLGSSPQAPYCEQRVHPQKDFNRPGWLRCEDYTRGMITGWGSHHFDIAHWGMGTELTGPIAAVGKAEWPKNKIWNVHGIYHVELNYANGATVIVDDKYPNGVRFEGDKGWIFVSRGAEKATASDPVTPGRTLKALDASDEKLLKEPLGKGAVLLPVSNDHYKNWLDAVVAGTQPIAPVEVAHRSCSACLVAWTAMKLERKVVWDPAKEHFSDQAAQALVSRFERAPYGALRTAAKKQ